MKDFGHPSMVGGLIVNAAPVRASAGAAGAMFGALSSMEPAGHGQRILARILDAFVQGLICLLGFVPAIFLAESLGPIGVWGLIVGVLFLAIAVYDPYFIATKGATPGKSAVGLRVVSKDGGPVGVGQAIARSLLRQFFEGLFLLVLVPLITQRRQGLHDMIVGTYVVRA